MHHSASDDMSDEDAWEDSEDAADAFEDCLEALDSVVLPAIAPGIPGDVKAIRMELRLDRTREEGMEVRIGSWSGLPVPSFAVPPRARKALAGFAGSYAGQFAPPDSGADPRPLMSWYATRGPRGRWTLGGGQSGGDPFVTTPPADQPRVLESGGTPVQLTPNESCESATPLGKLLSAMWAGKGRGLRVVRGGTIHVSDGRLVVIDPDAWPVSVAFSIEVPNGAWELQVTDTKDPADPAEAVVLRRTAEPPARWFALVPSVPSVPSVPASGASGASGVSGVSGVSGDDPDQMDAPSCLAWTDGAGLRALGAIWCRGEASMAAVLDEVAAARAARATIVRIAGPTPCDLGISAVPRGDAQLWLGADRSGAFVALVVTETYVEE